MSGAMRTTKGFRPSHYAPDIDPREDPDVAQAKERRIRTYMRRVRLRKPLFDPPVPDVLVASTTQAAAQ